MPRGQTTGQCDSLDARVVDYPIGLLMRDEEIGIESLWRARIGPELFKCDAALRHTTGVLHHQGIARHQVRACNAGQLVIGKVPWLDAEDHAYGAGLHMGFAKCWIELYRRKKTLGILRVIGKDVCAEVHFSARFVNQFPHLKSGEFGKLIHICPHQLCGSSNDLCTLGIRSFLPGLVTGRRGCNLLFELRIGQLWKLLDGFTVIRIYTFVCHFDFLFS